MDMVIGILVGLTFGGILMYWGEKTSDKVINELTEKLKYCYSLDQVLEMENKWVAEVDDLKEELENTEDVVTQMRTDSKKEFKRIRAAYDNDEIGFLKDRTEELTWERDFLFSQRKGLLTTVLALAIETGRGNEEHQTQARIINNVVDEFNQEEVA